MILTNDKDLAKKFNSTIFPSIQNGPLIHMITGKTVAFSKALRPKFKTYQAQVIKNTQALANQLMKNGLDIVTGSTDTHMMLVDLRPKGIKSNATKKALSHTHITCNKNNIPFDPEKPMVTSRIHLGTPASTTRDFRKPEFRQISDWIIEVTEGLAANGEDNNGKVEAKVHAKIKTLCDQFPIYTNL